MIVLSQEDLTAIATPTQASPSPDQHPRAGTCLPGEIRGSPLKHWAPSILVKGH